MPSYTMTTDPIASDVNVHGMTTRSRSRSMRNRNQSGDISGGHLNKSKTADLSSSNFEYRSGDSVFTFCQDGDTSYMSATAPPRSVEKSTTAAGFIPHRICRDDNFRGGEMVRKEDDRVSKEGIVVGVEGIVVGVEEIAVGVEEIAFVSILIISTFVFSGTPLIWIWTIGIFIIIINCVFGEWTGNCGYDEDNQIVYDRSAVFDSKLRILDGHFRY